MRYLWIMAALVLAGCGGRASHVDQPGAPVAAQTAELTFPVDRESSSLTGTVLLGKDTQSRSNEAVDQGDALKLPASSSTQFAVYEFSGVTQTPDHLDIVLKGSETTAAWIGLANFTTQRWVMSGPVPASQFLPVSAADNVSPLGNVYVAVVVNAGESATIAQLQLASAGIGPVAALQTTPATGKPPLEVDFDASSSTAPAGPIILYAWDWNGDGTYDATSSGPTIQHTYSDTGTYDADVRITDSHGATDVASTIVTVTPHPLPVARITASPQEGHPGDPVQLDASTSSDADGSIISYQWDLDGDGNFEVIAGTEATRSFNLPSSLGTVEVGLRVVDNLGLTAKTSLTLTSTNQPRVAVVNDAGQSAPFQNVWPVSPGVYDVRLNIVLLYGAAGYLVEYNPDFTGTGLWTTVPGDPPNATDPMDQVNGYPTAGPHAPTVRVTQPVPGDYTFAVRVTDQKPLAAGDASQVYVFTDPVSLRPAFRAIFSATPEHGAPGEIVQLDASGSADNAGNIVKYEWDLDGDGVYEIDNGLVITQAVALPDPAGKLDVSLRVTDDTAASATATLTLSSLPEWTALDVTTTGSADPYPSLAVVGGKPAVSYFDVAARALKYAYSSTIDGSGSWNTVTVAITSGFNSDFPSSLAEVNGCPAFSYYDDFNSDLRYAYSILTDGSGGWTVLTIDNAGSVGDFNSLAVINGKPAISYNDYSHRALKYAYSSTPDGSAGWNTLTVDNDGRTGYGTSLALVNGNPAISYVQYDNGEVRFAYSSAPDGSSGWLTTLVESFGTTGWAPTSLAVVNGRPAISYCELLDFGLKFARSNLADGSGGWNSLTVDSTHQAGVTSSLAVINGYPAISYYTYQYGSTAISYAYSSSPNGTSGWNSLTVDQDGQFDRSNSLAAVNGYPALAYFDRGSANVKFAYAHWP